MYSGMVYCGMQAKFICICICSGIKVGLLYNNAGYICDVKCIESDSHSANYTSFMLNTINATIFKLIYPTATSQVVDSQWPYLVVGHLC